MPLPAGRYRLVGERRKGEHIYYFADEFDVAAGQTTTRVAPALGELNVHFDGRRGVSHYGFAWLVPSTGGRRLAGDTPRMSWVFHVPEGNYLLGTEDAQKPRPVSVRAGAPQILSASPASPSQRVLCAIHR